MINIGRCTTCQNLFCTMPNIRKTHPQLGCAEWTTAKSRAAMQKTKTMIIVKVKD